MLIMRRVFAVAVLISCALGIALAVSQKVHADDDALWALLKKPGYFVLMRHSYSPEMPDDADVVDFNNCATQRNLDESGRAQARRVGDEFRKRGITRANLLASQYCRAMETAKLTGLGPVRALPPLNMVRLADFGKRGEAQQYLKTLPAGPVTVMVTHVGNIQTVAGPLVSSGEMLVGHLDASGSIVVDGRIKVP